MTPARRSDDSQNECRSRCNSGRERCGLVLRQAMEAVEDCDEHLLGIQEAIIRVGGVDSSWRRSLDERKLPSNSAHSTHHACLTVTPPPDIVRPSGNRRRFTHRCLSDNRSN